MHILMQIHMQMWKQMLMSVTKARPCPAIAALHAIFAQVHIDAYTDADSYAEAEVDASILMKIGRPSAALSVTKARPCAATATLLLLESISGVYIISRYRTTNQIQIKKSSDADA